MGKSKTTKFFTTSYHNYDMVKCDWWRKKKNFSSITYLTTSLPQL